jgi:hypothetical protein
MGRLPTGPPDPPNGRGEAEPGVVAGPPLPDAEPPVPAGRFPTAGVVPGLGLAGVGVAGACPPDAWGVVVGETGGVPGLGGAAADPAGRGALRLRIGGRFRLANGRGAVAVDGLAAGVEVTVAAGETDAVEAWDGTDGAAAAAAAGVAGVGSDERSAGEGAATSEPWLGGCTLAGTATEGEAGRDAAVPVVGCGPLAAALAPALAVTVGAIGMAAAPVPSATGAAVPAGADAAGAAVAGFATFASLVPAGAAGAAAAEVGPRPTGVPVPATGRCR